ncbi:MAG: TPM domain-containing protein [Aquisalimonadaceae bacterium]
MLAVRHLWAIPALLLCMVAAHAQPNFPSLTGRVVDQAGVLDAQIERRLSQALEAHENTTTEQVVVVTLDDLQGYPIEDYGYQLGRQWGIGQAGSDNGALLIVALEERRVRIEVGYGLEGRLTDAQSAIIINQVITPAFRQGDYAQGIVNGVDAILRVLGGEPLQGRSAAPSAEERDRPSFSPLFVVLLFVIISMLRGGGRRGLLGGLLLGSALGRGRSRGGIGGGGRGGFGGGGGGFGGGGASGGW